MNAPAESARTAAETTIPVSSVVAASTVSVSVVVFACVFVPALFAVDPLVVVEVFVPDEVFVEVFDPEEVFVDAAGVVDVVPLVAVVEVVPSVVPLVVPSVEPGVVFVVSAVAVPVMLSVTPYDLISSPDPPEPLIPEGRNSGTVM